MLNLKNIISFLSTIIILTLISGCAVSIYTNWFYDPLYRDTLLNYFFIAFIFVTVVFLAQHLVFKIYFKNKIVSTFLQGLTCTFIEILLIFLVTLPVFGIEPRSLLLHFWCIASVCFFIPFLYNAIKVAYQ